MRTNCPRCGEPIGSESVVGSVVNMWSKCGHCQWVWQSSLLENVVGAAIRGVGLGRSSKAVEPYAASIQADLSPPPAALPVGADSVAQWLMSQETAMTAPKPRLAAASSSQDAAAVEAYFDQLDPVVPAEHSDADDEDDFYSFFTDAPVNPDETPAAGAKPCGAVAREPLDVLGASADASEAIGVVERAASATEEGAPASIDDLYDAFKRLEQQLDGMEKWCEGLGK